MSEPQPSPEADATKAQRSNPDLVSQLERERHTVGFDNYDMSIRELIGMVSNDEINVAPEYQRHFVWKSDRQSELIESVALGIPIPPLFMATNKDGTWEVVDGVQRLSTLIHFCGDEGQRSKLGLLEPLRIEGLDKLDAMNERTFLELPRSMQLSLLSRPLRVTTLNDKSNMSVRFDLFERLNSGGVKLQPQEIRNCVYRGQFNRLLSTLSEYPNFRAAVRLDSQSQNNKTYEEYVLRYFAFLNGYRSFDHSVTDFLNSMMATGNATPPSQEDQQRFREVCDFIASELPDGIVRSRSVTPVNLFEAIFVGVGLVLKRGGSPRQGVLRELLGDPDLRSMTSGGTNNRKMVIGRIEFVVNKIA